MLGVTGELLITFGLVVLLFVTWQLWWTDVLARQAYDEIGAELQQQWGLDRRTGREPTPVKAEYGQAFGLLYVPALRDRAWAVPIIQGADHWLLTDGVGHHMRSAMPGEVGNVAIAGHRTTYGAPFADIDRQHPGDQVLNQTKGGWYVYALDRSVIIDAGDGWVLDPVPGEPRTTTPTRELITIYACHPKFSAAQRFVWFGHLVDKYARGFATPPAIEQYGKEA